MLIGYKEVFDLLSSLDTYLERPSTICLIGSGTTIILGQPARMTKDINVWRPACLNVSDEDLRDAVVKAGWAFNPAGELPTPPYLQVVDAGVVQVPGWNPQLREWPDKSELDLWKGNRLMVTAPPPAAIIASKLLRGSESDLEDSLWLMTFLNFRLDDVRKAVAQLPAESQDVAAENLETLDLLRRPIGLGR